MDLLTPTLCDLIRANGSPVAKAITPAQAQELLSDAAFAGCRISNPLYGESEVQKLRERRIDAVFETDEDGIIGTQRAPVKRTEEQDDGTLTVVIDYWPAPRAIVDADSPDRDIGYYLEWALGVIAEVGFEEFAQPVEQVHREATAALRRARALQSPLRALPHGWNFTPIGDDEIRVSAPEDGPGVVTVGPTGALERRVLWALAQAAILAQREG